MNIFQEIRKAIEQSGHHTIAATVISADPEMMTVNVKLEGEDVIREKIPIRIFNDEGGLGIGFIPKVESEVLVAFVNGAENRPQVIKVQEWEWMIARKGAGDTLVEFVIDNENKISLRRGSDLEMTIDENTRVDLRKSSGFQFTIDADDKVSIGNVPTHKLALGDIWLEKFNSHIHPTPTGPSGPPMQPLIDNEVNSQIFEVE